MVLGGPCEGVVGLHVGNRCSKVCLGSALGELFTLSVELLTLEDFSLLEVFLTFILFSPSQIHITYILGKRSTVELACCPGAVESCRLDKIPVPTVSLSHTSCQSVLLHYF